MKVGVLLPLFRRDADHALNTARRARDLGLHGVFAYDHLWPMGRPDRPALSPWPVLGAVAGWRSGLFVGPLVARVGLSDNVMLAAQLNQLTELSPGRLIAGLGTGDHLSDDENRAFGVAVESADERRARLRAVVAMLEGAHEVWIGAGESATNAVARELGAVLNLWDKSAERVRTLSRDGAVNWAGLPREDLETQLDELADAGASWAVLTPSCDLERLATWVHAQKPTTVS